MEEDSVSRDDNIKYNLQSYLPCICQCVDGAHLLLYLDCYSGDQRREINQLNRTSPVEATRKAFEILMQKESPGIFTALLQSLKEVYPKIAKLLQGDVVKCDENYRRVTELLAQTVVRQINPIQLLIHLRKYGVLTEEEAEEVRAEERNFGPIRAASYIITNIHRHVEDWFKYFIMCLMETDCENIAELLDKDMVEKIKAQTEFDSENTDICKEESCAGLREHLNEVVHEASSCAKLENAYSSLNAKEDITDLKRTDPNHHTDQYEHEGNLNTNSSHQKDEIKLLNITQEEDDITALKQRLRQNQTETEAVKNTNEESADENHGDVDDDLDNNDLDKSEPETGDSDSDDSSKRNITTDLDEIKMENVTEHKIELRGYQKKLAKKGCEGENAIIMAPTNSGKTRVACQIVLSMFKRREEQEKVGKAAFVVDKEELAFQQGKVFEEELPAYRTKIVTGDVQQSRAQHLKDYVHRRDVLVMTAQVLLNCLKAKDIESLDVFDIIVFDECHHTDKKHPYKKIMDHYFEQRLKNAIALPQIIGLTASIGVGGKLDRSVAFENMKQIAANLDAKVLCTVDDEVDEAEMKKFINNPDECIVTVPRRATERFNDDILHAVEKIDTFMRTNPSVTQLAGTDSFIKTISRVPTRIVGKSQFQSWLSDFRRGLSVLESDNARQILNPCLRYLEQYHAAVMLYNDARIKDAMSSLKRFVDKRRQSDFNNEADQFLIQLFDGMTKTKQRNVLGLFKNGRHKIIIATTVAEEGLDIAMCNLVIKYEHVTNERARVQCRGRARAPNSKYYVLTEQGSDLVEKEEFNARCEKLMQELIPVLKMYVEQNRNRWEDEILQMQRNAKEVREAQSRQQQAAVTDDIVNLHCGNCGTMICSSEDVKKICGMHHIVVADIREKIVLERSLKPSHVDKTNEIIMGGNTFCSNKICIYKHKIGGIVQYKKMDFPVLAIKNICIKNQNGRPLPPAKQWSKVAFKVESIDTANLLMIMHERSLD